ncbi:M16 family metallopeptidase [Methylobrevis pamukkalensis]|uniref:Peptidase M16 inactive domain protein n=1 Tax=Methylobrevis pamukkalensis TaxID=1439726 RepID=A0A1E3H5W8_9HYPH|nr:pitrilysin family protein [Methylobrevis pamukkalensis]ODN71728.1 Peptidase M16 inactive domain protein [Methylobrevis pamukkalensis]
MLFTSLRVRSSLLPALAAALMVLVVSVTGARATTVQRVVSPGGVEAWLVEDHAVPLVAMQFAFRGGASADPADKPGLANLLSTLLDEGAGDLDAQAFRAKLEENAVRLGFSAGRDSFSGNLGMLENRKAEAFDLLALALARPRFEDEAIERMRAAVLAGLRSDVTDPGTIATRAFNEMVFGDHPYARPVDGTIEAVAAISREDLDGLRQRLFARSNLVVGVVGAVSAEELKPLLDVAFGGLPAEASIPATPEATPVFGGTQAAEVPGPQTEIRIGTTGLLRRDPDFMAAYVMDHILGGGSFSSRLYTEIREKRGLAYSVWSTLVPYDQAGLYLAGTSTRADQAEATLALLTAELRKMAEEGPTAEELASAKKFLTGSYALRFDGSGKIAAQLVGLQLENLPIDYFTNRNALVEAVTLEDVKRVAKRLLDGPYTVVTVGPAAG